MNFTDPRSASPRLEHGRHYHQSGDLALAESIYRQILKDEPENARALHLLGLIAGQTGNPDAGLELIEKSIASDPGDPDAQSDLGNFRLSLGDSGGAEAAYRTALEIDPTHVMAALNLSVILRDQNCHDENLAMLNQVVRAHPHDARALNALGAALVHAGDAAVAIDYLLDTVAIDPADADAYNNLGLAYHMTGQFDEAIGAFTAAIARNSNLAEARWNRVVTWMQTGAWRSGLSEWHWRRHDKRFRDRNLPQALWDGVKLFDEPVLITAEQGIGDQIVFSSLLPLAKERGVRPILECEPRLVDLFARSYPGIDVVAKPEHGDPHPLSHDVGLRMSVIDLAQLMPGRPEKLRAQSKFLVADAKRQATFARQLKKLGPAPYIGISWRSGGSASAKRKSLELAQLKPILEKSPGTFINLQYGETDAEIAELSEKYGVKIHTLPELDRMNDLDGLAALSASLDLVITINNVTAPIAAGVGTPTWVMVRQAPLWYWGGKGATSPFLPSARLFRQDEDGVWDPVIKDIGRGLDTLTGGNRHAG